MTSHKPNDEIEHLKSFLFTSEQKMDFIKEEITTGHYTIDNKKIAAKLLEERSLFTESEIA